MQNHCMLIILTSSDNFLLQHLESVQLEHCFNWQLASYESVSPTNFAVSISSENLMTDNMMQLPDNPVHYL